MRLHSAGTGRSSHPPQIGAPMSQDLGLSLLTVLGVIAGIGALLYVLAVLDPTSVRTAKQLPSHRAPRGRADT
jgi:hypothetical protein